MSILIFFTIYLLHLWWENCAKEIIYAADKYGVINLKLEAEAVYMLTQLRLQ